MAYIRNLISIISPKNMTQGISLDTVITIQFESSMNIQSINNQSIKLFQNNNEVTTVLRYSRETKVLTIKPEVLLEPGSKIELVFISGINGVKTAIGDTLMKEIVYSFNTSASSEDTPNVEVPSNPIIDEIPEVDIGNEETPIVDVDTNLDNLFPETGTTTPDSNTTIDLSDFHIVETYPSNNGIWNTKEPIAIRFSLPILQGQENKISLFEKPLSDLLLITETVPFTINYSEDNKTIFIKPSIEIKSNSGYTLKIEKTFSSNSNLTIERTQSLNIWTQPEFSYLTVEELRLAGGDFASQYTDAQLINLIGLSSKDVYQNILLYKELYLDDTLIITSEVFPYGTTQYVLNSVLYKLVLNESLVTATGRSKNITLGDLTVGGSGSTASNLPDLLKLLKDEIDRWWKIITKRNPFSSDSDNPAETIWIKDITSSTRGLNNYPYPDFQTRVPFNELGGNV